MGSWHLPSAGGGGPGEVSGGGLSAASAQKWGRRLQAAPRVRALRLSSLLFCLLLSFYHEPHCPGKGGASFWPSKPQEAWSRYK